MSSIHEKLCTVQRGLQVPKDQYNSYGHYRYRTAESILGAVKPLLIENGLIVTISDNLELRGNRYYVKATATLRDVETGECIETQAWAREEGEKKGMDSSQITGAASSYARKYALCGLLAINDGRDADATNTGDDSNAGPAQAETKGTDAETWENIQKLPKRAL